MDPGVLKEIYAISIKIVALTVQIECVKNYQNVSIFYLVQDYLTPNKKKH